MRGKLGTTLEHYGLFSLKNTQKGSGVFIGTILVELHVGARITHHDKHKHTQWSRCSTAHFSVLKYRRGRDEMPLVSWTLG